MARKALFDEFKNILYGKNRNFLIFGNLKHDLQKKVKNSDKIQRTNMHGFFS
jgi:hypothetical protein